MRPGDRLPWDWYDEPLPENLIVGDRSWIYSSFAFVHHRSRRPDAIRIGSDSGVYIGTVFETGPQAQVEIGDYCALAGPILVTDGRIVIGDFAFISWGVAIADSFAPVPPDGDDEQADTEAALTMIGENVWVGTNASILGGARVGEGAVIGALSVVDFDVPPYAVVAGNPARIVGDARERQRAG